MSATRSIETVVVGAGQAGLLMSDLLRHAGREHIVVDRRSSLGGGWQDRWDGFRLVGPNWTTTMPSFAYDGPEPDGYMPRDEVIDHWRRYARAVQAPLELETEVSRLVTRDGADAARFEVTTSGGTIAARDVIVAAGPFQRPNVPPLADGLASSILSLHSHDYRSPWTLPPGGVLLVGSGQTGVQLAEELHEAGRAVTMSLGHCGTVPRRYRTKDIFWWLREMGTRGVAVGTPLPTPDKLPSPAARFACNPQLSGHHGGHDVNLRRMAADGIRLVGRLEGVDGTRARFRADLNENLRFAETFFETRFRADCDTFIERVGEALPAQEEDDAFSLEVPEVPELDLAAEGIGTVIWTSGYRPAFGWIELPVLDEFGLPIQKDGRTAVEGLSFIGTPWLVDMGSANLIGLVRDAEVIAATW
ncbi:MAG TPA: NAD(P)-binding domain-containing protein [Candidatus Limnocylindrales bacterium]